MQRIMAFLAMVVVLPMLAVQATATPSSVPFILADFVHAQKITGKGVTVAVIDSGIDYAEHGLLGSIAPGGVSIVSRQYHYDSGADVYADGHGTFMSLIITDSTGVAPDASILPVRIGDLWDVVEGIQYVTARRNVDPTIRVINLSIGSKDYWYPCSCDEEGSLNQDLADAISRAMVAGIITFAATGNRANCGAICAPACVSDAVKVAADYDDYYEAVYFDPPADCMDLSPDPYWVTCFSNITEECNWLLAAPGYDISVGGFVGWWGTSCATPHCSGVAALMFSKNACGTLSAYQARQIIYNTATDIWWGDPYCDLPPEPRHVNALAAVDAVSGPFCSVLGDLDGDGLGSGFGEPRAL